jgi:hypothetical protein
MRIKNILFAIVISMFFSPVCHGEKETTDPAKKSEATAIERDKLISVTGRHFENNNYFKLKMLNESKAGFYSMVRIYPDGKIESVEIKNITVNTINKPLLYCFVDKQTPNVDFTYALYRISSENEIVQLWNYYAAEKTIMKYSEVTCPILVKTPVKTRGFLSSVWSSP